MTDKPSDTPTDETDSGETRTTPPAADTGTGASSSAPKKTPRPPRQWPWRLVRGLVMILVLAGIGALGYGYWLQHQAMNQLRADLQQGTETQHEQAAAVSDRVEQLRERLAKQDQTLNQARQANESLREEITGLRRQLTEVTATTNDDWKLAEAHYLTRLAGQRLVMERNPQGALALLQAADEILKNRDDPDLYPIREQLAEDITALKLATGIDREGIFLALSALGEAAEVLPAPTPSNYRPRENGRPRENSPSRENGAANTAESVNTDENADENAGDNNGGSNSGSAWQQVRQSFNSALAGFGDFIRVTHSDRPIPKALSPEAQGYLQTSLRLHLESAQWALLREQPRIYRDSLDKATQLLDRFYPLSREAEQLVAQIGALRSREIVQTLPDISQSQKLLSDYLEKRHRLQDDTAGAAANGENQP